MIWLGKDTLRMEPDEPVFRSCWECNTAHKQLKTANALHACFDCGRFWVFDRFMDTLETDADFEAFFSAQGMKPGDSTTTIDKGYRLTCISINLKEGEK